jgi:diguanylate cyclase (GGDEF)-like protein
MIMDIDHFKKINDTYGHAVGDEVLRSFAQIIRNTIRQNDIPCRIGGEEFVVACRQTSESEAMRLAERLRQAAVNMPFQLDDLAIPFAISVGVTTTNSAEDSLDSVFKHADRALYHSKQQGRNRVTHYADLEDQAQQA